MPPLVAGQLIARTDEASAEAGAGAGVKLEMATDPAVCADVAMRRHSEPTAPSSDGSNVGGNSCSSRSTKRIRGTMPVALRHPVAVDDGVCGEADADVTLKLAVSAPFPHAGFRDCEREIDEGYRAGL